MAKTRNSTGAEMRPIHPAIVEAKMAAHIAIAEVQAAAEYLA
jgi:hypothetical protein